MKYVYQLERRRALLLVGIEAPLLRLVKTSSNENTSQKGNVVKTTYSNCSIDFAFTRKDERDGWMNRPEYTG